MTDISMTETQPQPQSSKRKSAAPLYAFIALAAGCVWAGEYRETAFIDARQDAARDILDGKQSSYRCEDLSLSPAWLWKKSVPVCARVDKGVTNGQCFEGTVRGFSMFGNTSGNTPMLFCPTPQRPAGYDDATLVQLDGIRFK